MVQVPGSSFPLPIQPLPPSAGGPVTPVPLRTADQPLPQTPAILDAAAATQALPGGSASQSLALFDNPPDLSSLQQSLQTQLSLRNLPVAQRGQLNQQLQALEQALNSGTPAQQREAVAQLQRSLQQNGMLHGQIRQDLETLSVSLVQQHSDVALAPLRLDTELIGFDGEPGQARDEADAFVMRLRQQERLPDSLSKETLLLMSLRDELLRRQLEMARGLQSVHPQHQNPNAGYIETELPLIGNALKMVDAALGSTRDLPPQLLGDLQNTVASLSQARPGEALSNLRAPDLNLPALPDAPELPARPQLPAEANRVAAWLAEQAATPAPDLTEGFSEVMAGYSTVMDKVENTLPPLWFPITLPIPLAYSDGNTSFVVPAGTQLSQNRRTGDYTAQMPGFVVLTDGTTVMSKNLSLHLGPNLDGLKMDELFVNDGSTQTHLQGVNATLNRSQQSATIAAESVQIDSQNGTFLLQNAQVMAGPQGFNGSFDSLDLPNGSRFGQTQISQSTADGTSSLNASTQNMQLLQGSQQILAEQLQLQLVQSEAGQQLLLQGNGLQIHDADSQILADQAQLQVLNNADGSGLIQLSGENIHWQQGSQQINAPGQSSLNLTRHADGYIEALNVQSDQLSYGDGERLGSVSQGALNLAFDPAGQLQSAGFSAEQVQWRDGSQVLNASQSQLNLNYDPEGNLQFTGQVEQLDFSNSDLNLQAQNTSVQLQANAAGQLEQIQASNGGLNLSGDWGELQTEGLSTLKLNYSEGQLQQVQATSEQLNFAQGAEQLQLNGVDLNLNYHEGQLQNASGSLSSGDFQGAFGQASLSGGALELGFANQQLSSIQAGADYLQLSNHEGQLDLAGSQLNAAFGEDGALSQLHFSGESVQYQGQQAALNFGLQDFALDVNALADGGHQLQFNGQNLSLDSQGQQLQLESIRQLALQTRPDGSLDTAQIHLDGHNTFSNENLNLAVQNFQGHYQQEGNLLDLRFDQGQLQTQNLNLNVQGGQLLHNDQQLSLHIDSAEVIAQLEQELNAKVENLDLILNKHSDGQISSADLLVGGLDAQVQGLNALIRTQNGDQVRLHLGLSEDGTFLREAFLQIPSGGEIQLQQDDLNLRLGGGQKLSFSQDGQGYYTFRGEGLDVNLANKDARVSIQGGTAQVSLDTQRGDLIIDEITGVGISAEVGGQQIDVDIEQMEGFLVKATGISGLAQGAALHLVPTSDASRMTAEIRTSYNGLPISVKIDNVHELKALATVQPNRAHVYFGDPSGTGTVEVNAGPIKASGSALEYVVQYNQYDPMRMMTTLSRALSSDGYEIVKGVQVEADGVLRLQTPFKNGPHAGLTLLFPRPGMSQANPHSFYQPQEAQSPSGDGAMGGIVELGWKGTNAEGTQTTGALHAGLVPGSYLGIHQLQGKTSVAGITLPSNIEVPTTAIAGVTFRRHGDKDLVARGQESRTDFMLGGYVNPAGLVNSPLINEPNAYGAYAGVEWRKNNMSVGFSSTVDLSQPKPSVGGMLRFGISF